jgi:hypothetical protein
MQGFERIGDFSRAVRASRAASAACWDPFNPYVDDLQFAEGMLFGLMLVLPFWLTVAWALVLIVR